MQLLKAPECRSFGRDSFERIETVPAEAAGYVGGSAGLLSCRRFGRVVVTVALSLLSSCLCCACVFHCLFVRFAVCVDFIHKTYPTSSAATV